MTKQTSKPRFNIIDAVVVLILAAIIAFGVWFFGGAMDEHNVYVYFTVEFRNQAQGFEEFIEIGGEVRDSVRNYFLGYIVNIEVLPAHIINFDFENLEYVLETIPDRNDIYLTIRGRGTASDYAIHVEGHLVTIGREMNIRGRGFVNRGFITMLRTQDLH